MKIFDVKKTVEQMNPGKNVSVDLDNASICAFELICDGGNPNLFGHVVFHKAKIQIEGMDPMYMPIEHHRQPVGIAEMKRMFAGFIDVNFPEDVMMNLDQMDKQANMKAEDKLLLSKEEKAEAEAAPENLAQFRADLKSSSGLDDAAINAKLEAYRNG